MEIWQLVLSTLGLCSGGFIFLLILINKNMGLCESLKSSIDKNQSIYDFLDTQTKENSKLLAVLDKSIESRTTHEYVHEKFYEKENARLQFEHINREFEHMNRSFDDQKRILEMIQSFLMKKSNEKDTHSR